MSEFDTHAAASAVYIAGHHSDPCTYQRKAGGAPLSLRAIIDETDLARGASLPEVNSPFGAATGRYATSLIRSITLDQPAYGDTITDVNGVVWSVQTFRRVPGWWELTVMSDQRITPASAGRR